MQLSGRRLLHYDVLEELGEGGMGVVYRAVDTHLDRYVALKVLPPEKIADAGRKRRFVQEAKAASALNHPNIITIYDITADAGLDFIVMEYVDGRTLSSLIREGLSTRDVLRYAVPVAEALARAHSGGIIHRDVKPSNIMVDKDGHVKLLDFGLAKLTETIADSTTDSTRTLRVVETEEGTLLGTVAYMSPEQVEGRPIDSRSDEFSFGAVLYEMLTGKRAFAGESAISTLAAILRDDPPPVRQLVRDVPPSLESMVNRCLRKDRHQRYPSVTSLVANLEACRLELDSVFFGGINLKLLLRQSRRPRFLVPGLLLAAGVTFLGVRGYQRYTGTQWAATQALPEIVRLIGEDKIGPAYAIAVKAEKYLPNDPVLEKSWLTLAREVTVETTPDGAGVFRKDYDRPDAPWELVGRSPVVKVRVPRGMTRWKIEKPGFLTVEGSFSNAVNGGPDTIRIALDPEEKAPAGMVRVPTTGGGRGRLSISGLEALPEIGLEDFWIDRYEVTNRQFKQFVDAGGYRNRAYWKEPFRKAGVEIKWEEAATRFLDATGRPGPAGWQQGDYPAGEAEYPVAGVSWYEAVAYCEFAGKSLPTIWQWNRAAGVPTSASLVPASNFGGKGPAPVGSFRGLGPWGTYDMAGNVKEWCWNEGKGERRYALGGSWDEPVYLFNDSVTHSPFDRLPNLGFRSVKYISTAGPGPAAAPVLSPARDYSREKPCSDELFRVYRSFYAYDKAPLNARVEAIDDIDGFRTERITFDAAYGNERVIAFLVLPARFKPPFQTAVVFPSSNMFQDKAPWPPSHPEVEGLAFLLKSGRAVMFPEFKAGYERRDNLVSDTPNMSALYRDHVIAWAKDLGRSVDYLETRPEIDRAKLAYFASSLGARMAPLMTAVEDRFQVSVIQLGGFRFQKSPPEVDPFHFAPHVKIPTLLLSGRFDFLYPVETAQMPLFRMLGTPTEHKRHVLYDTSHAVPRNERIKEALDWLDRYLGPPQ